MGFKHLGSTGRFSTEPPRGRFSLSRYVENFPSHMGGSMNANIEYQSARFIAVQRISAPQRQPGLPNCYLPTPGLRRSFQMCVLALCNCRLSLMFLVSITAKGVSRSRHRLRHIIYLCVYQHCNLPSLACVAMLGQWCDLQKGDI